VTSWLAKELNSIPETCFQSSGTGSEGFRTASVEMVGREVEDSSLVVVLLEVVEVGWSDGGLGGGKAVRVEAEVSRDVVEDIAWAWV